MRIYKKNLADGGTAIGFFNLGATTAAVQFKEFAQLGLTGKQHVRDLRRQKNLLDVDTTSELLPLGIPAHGVLLYKFTAAK